VTTGTCVSTSGLAHWSVCQKLNHVSSVKLTSVQLCRTVHTFTDDCCCYVQHIVSRSYTPSTTMRCKSCT